MDTVFNWKRGAQINSARAMLQQWLEERAAAMERGDESAITRAELLVRECDQFIVRLQHGVLAGA